MNHNIVPHAGGASDAGATTCDRCGGFLLERHFENLDGSAWGWAYDGWMCLNCGDVVDPLIVQNRSLQGKANDPIPARSYDGGKSKIGWLRMRDDAVAGGSAVNPCNLSEVPRNRSTGC